MNSLSSDLPATSGTVRITGSWNTLISYFLFCFSLSLHLFLFVSVYVRTCARVHTLVYMYMKYACPFAFMYILS